MYLLEMKNIHKLFPGVYALKGVNLQLNAGEVLAVIGENGAGKSTLINILGGIYQRNEGEILMNGEPVEINTIRDAQKAGISIIHQELVLEPRLTVAENIYINRYPMKHGMVDHKAMFHNAQAHIDELGLQLRADDLVYKLSIAEQQMVEIVKAVSFQSRVIVMDEPTSSISNKEVEVLFENIRMLKKRGIGIIYISHRMSELQEVCDDVLVLRDGESVAHCRVSETNNDELVKWMVGREISNYYTRTYNPVGQVLLEVEGLTSASVKNVSFQLRAGEILGFAGLVGAGRSETMKAILGFDKKTAGKIRLEGREITIREPRDAYRLGIGFVPENRRDEGIIPLQTVRFNTSLKILDRFIDGIRVNHRREEEITDAYIQKLKIKTASHQTRLLNLSGGNQQKVVISSWLANEPKILIMDEPTRGIDVGAKAEIYALMNDLAAEGVAIIMISSELPEIINMSDRVVVMRSGEISAVIDHDKATQETIMQYAVNI